MHMVHVYSLTKFQVASLKNDWYMALLMFLTAVKILYLYGYHLSADAIRDENNIKKLFKLCLV